MDFCVNSRFYLWHPEKDLDSRLGFSQTIVAEMAQIRILDQFLKRDLSVPFSLRKFESQKLLRMERSGRLPKQSFGTPFRSTISYVSTFRRILLQQTIKLPPYTDE